MKGGKIWLAMVLATIFAAVQGARAQAPNLNNNACLSCHGQPGFSTKLANGKTRSLYVSVTHFADSVHRSFQCTTCHTDVTAIPHKTGPLSPTQWRQQVPKICGACHVAELKGYSNSVHSSLVMKGIDVHAAVCTDCHTAHAVVPPETPAARLAIGKACGTCHAEALASYEQTYHGQMFALGYANVAMCADCHRGHSIQPASDPASSVSSANRLETCRNCHANATAGFATFDPHATTDDFSRYPYVYVSAQFMFWLVVLTLGAFWFHCALWLFAELRDRFQHRPRPHVLAQALPQPHAENVERWSISWRLTHLVFAVSVIALIMTGIPLLYPTSGWAPILVRALGGEESRAIIHRVAAVIMLVIFFGHLVYVGIYLVRNWESVALFGPNSLLPTKKDGRDFLKMLEWFAGVGPRPMFDHWNYQQKFDYWAVFWGVAILALTGFMLWFKNLTLAFLPGFALNPATIVHGHECVLAAVYLFTIHFFVNHWRPDKFPLDIVIFTGSMPLEEYRREFPAEYERLARTGELASQLVEQPSAPMRIGSTILGAGLIFTSLVLLVLIMVGGFLNI